MTRLRERPLRIEQLSQIKALTAPIRQDLVDCLQASGPCTVAQLAQYLGRPADSLYYHLRRLEALGLVVRPRGQSRRELVTRFALPARRPRLEYRPDDPCNVEAVTSVAEAMLRSASRGFRKAFASHIAVVRGRHRNLWAGRAIGWLSDEELSRVNTLLSRLVELIRQRHTRSVKGRQLHEFTYVLSPVVPRGKRKA